MDPSNSAQRSCTFLFLFVILGLSFGIEDYDDYSPESTEQTTTSENTLCPRAIPGQMTTKGNITFITIPASSRAHLSSAITRVLIPSLYTLVFLIGLPSNGLALWILATKIKKMTSTIFLINLALADLLLILVLPFKISYYFLGNNWLFGEMACRILTTFFYGNMYCSVLLLMSISIDRYLAVVHPFFSRSFRNKTFAICICSAVWFLTIISTVPLTTYQQAYPLYGSDVTLCHDVLPRHEQSEFFFYYFVCLIVFGFLIPLVIVIFCYVAVLRVLISNGEKYSYAIKLTALVLVTILVLLTPSNLVLLIHYSEHCFNYNADLYVVYMVCLALSTFNNCIDPFVYYYVSEEFREKIKAKLFTRRSTFLITSKETAPTSVSHSQSVL
ncbi:proteinase-activated receptor 4 [Microcaecilia unicolor]|uniref:Proteinase-activated receptor 4 n=1 Tax=Microcaecilia unicolor TaxID=1415580 RepID=A0A6P7ZKU0_9AMPH|nr:proteinase-activated receptor 4 [Microcaecilia unicolor]